MNILSFSHEKLPFLLINVVLFGLFSIILWKIHISFEMILIVGLAWFVPLIIAYLLEYGKKRRYYQHLIDYQESLDKKYLLPEILERPTFLEGAIVQDAIEIAYKQMHEHINIYKREQKDYQEYIETWVHEIKTPLSSAKLILNNRDIDYGVIQELDRTEQFIEQVLYFARSNNVSEDYLISKFSLREVVTRVAKKNAKDFIYKKIKLYLGELNEMVYSDKKWVEFILNQIVVNAIQYSKKASSEIQITSTPYDNKVVLQIKDNGIGIKKKDLPRVFDKGFTGETGRTYSKSTGLGLYLCKRLADKLNLGISIESKQNIHTTVFLVFPMNKSLLMEP
ncbi:Signal transduction histidine kinase [Virgibacillus chiguensis]|uniref:histidine kinase n=2 Tax=Virgibacillus chiguensis TaxID=411959 RepID=A0A1M5S7C2_9BACI|nr:Signal transduction histidine kinase [Virgibacillus chiguensis]